MTQRKYDPDIPQFSARKRLLPFAKPAEAGIPNTPKHATQTLSAIRIKSTGVLGKGPG
jgi:hypothetical protein